MGVNSVNAVCEYDDSIQRLPCAIAIVVIERGGPVLRSVSDGFCRMFGLLRDAIFAASKTDFLRCSIQTIKRPYVKNLPCTSVQRKIFVCSIGY